MKRLSKKKIGEIFTDFYSNRGTIKLKWGQGSSGGEFRRLSVKYPEIDGIKVGVHIVVQFYKDKPIITKNVFFKTPSSKSYSYSMELDNEEKELAESLDFYTEVWFKEDSIEDMSDVAIEKLENFMIDCEPAINAYDFEIAFNR